jgi:hypothetical protein
VNCLHGLYLKLQLTLHVLRTNISCEPWLTLSYTLFFLDGLVMVILGMSYACTQNIIPFIVVLWHV